MKILGEQLNLNEVAESDQPTLHRETSSQMITGPPFRYVTPDTYTSFIIYFYFLKLKKKKKYAPTHNTPNHVNHIVRFK